MASRNAPLTAEVVRAKLTAACVDQSELTITDDPTVWTNLTTGKTGTSVIIAGPDDARWAAHNVLFSQGYAVAPYPDEDYWSSR